VLEAEEPEPVIVEDEVDATWNDFRTARMTYLQALAQPLVACTEHAAAPLEDPADYPCTRRDWPSLLQAASGLAKIARRTSDRELARTAVETLSREVLGEVEKSLDTYGVADDPHAYVWVLVASQEHPANDALQTLARRVAEGIDGWLEGLPEDELMHGVLVGSRDSVAWIAQNLWQWAEASDAPAIAERMRAFTASRLDTPELDQFCDPTIDGAPTYDELFPPCLHRVFAVLTVLPGDHDDWLSQLVEKRRHLDPLEAPPLSTHAALNFSRSSSLWALFRATGDRTYLHAYVDHIQAQMASSWDGIRQADRAWVAQFGVQAIEASFGDEA